MAAKTVIEGSTVSGSSTQLKDFFRQIDEGSLTGAHLQALLDHRNPFEPKSPDSFDPVTVINDGWKVVGERKLLPAGFDPSRLKVVPTPLKQGEIGITGDETKKRLADQPLGGVEAYWRCWNDRDNLPSDLRDNIIYFDGDELRSTSGNHCSLYLYWGCSGWSWDYNLLCSVRHSKCVSALSG